MAIVDFAELQDPSGTRFASSHQVTASQSAMRIAIVVQ